MRYTLTLPDGTGIVSGDPAFVARLRDAHSLPESAVTSSDDSPETAALRNQAKANIDSLANEVYSVYVQSPGLLKEYQQAEDDAKAYVANPAVVPQSISSWANPKGWTNEQAAQDILTSAAKLRYVMGKIREVRLSYKSAIDNAKSVAEIQSLGTTGLIVLNKLKG